MGLGFRIAPTARSHRRGRCADAFRLSPTCDDSVAPADGFALIVDGHFKTRHDSEAAARAAGTELLGRFPMLQILVYDAATRVRSPLN